MCIPFVLTNPRAPYHFCVGRGIVCEIEFHPRAGIGQGDPFSPVLFCFCASFVLFRIEKVPRSTPYMYSDDLWVLITRWKIVPFLQRVHDCMTEFGIFSGLKLDIAKCGMVIKGLLHKDDQAKVASQAGERLLGILVQQSVKYLGVRIGNISSEFAYAYLLAEAQRRASVVAGLHLSRKERITLLKTWVLPTVLLTARAYFHYKITVHSRKIIFNTALQLNSWVLCSRLWPKRKNWEGINSRPPPPPPRKLGAMHNLACLFISSVLPCYFL